MADNEHDLHVALVEIFEADTGSGGLVGLTGQTYPLRRWGDRGQLDLPNSTAEGIVTIFFPVISENTVKSDRVATQFDIWTAPSSTGRAWKIADRIEAVVTNTALGSTARSNPVDAAPYFRTRRDLPELSEGRTRVTLEAEMWFNRS